MSASACLRRSLRAFTLVEMLVVIAIIALLLAVLLPAFDVVRTKARVAATQGQFAGLDTGIATYRGENALGGGLPPSSSDNNTTADLKKIADPKSNSANTKVRVAGAHLLVHALMGADGLGTPGFKDLDRDGLWWNDTFGGPIAPNATPKGLYSINQTTGETLSPRYGPFVEEKMREKTRSIQQLSDEGKLLNDPVDLENVAINEPMFVDAWGLPILYYKANSSALLVTADLSQNKPGIYVQEDNAIITGSEGGGLDAPALDFGSGTHLGHSDQIHYIHKAASPLPTLTSPNIETQLFEPQADTEFEHSLAWFIADRSVKARPTPVRKADYLLISAGKDSIYGSEDDVLNWTRKAE